MELQSAQPWTTSTGLIGASFTHFEQPAGKDYLPALPVMHKAGRGVLGVNAWRLLGLIHTDPMTGPHRAAWAAFVRRNPAGAIAAWAEVRGEQVDPVAVIETLKNARELDQPGRPLN